MFALFPEVYPCKRQSSPLSTLSTQTTCSISRPSSSDRNRADTFACVAPLTLIQQPLVAARNRKRELLLCVYACVRDGQWRSFTGRNLGGAPDSYWKARGRLRGDAGVIVADLQCHCLALLLAQLEPDITLGLMEIICLQVWNRGS